MTHPSKSAKSSLTELIFTIVLPTLILTKLSKPEALGTAYAFVIAISIPFAYGIYSLVSSRKVNIFAIIGIISVVLTGGIGLLHLSPKWVAIKEAGIPALIGIGLLISHFFGINLLKQITAPIINGTTLSGLSATQTEEIERHFNQGNLKFSLSFFISSFLNFVVAKWLVTSPAGTEAFNEELGRMTAISYLVIAVPMMVIMMVILWQLLRQLSKVSGHPIESLIAGDSNT